MLSLIEQLSDWTEARWPELTPFIAGLATAVLGLGALVLLTVGLAPAKLVTLMPLWLCLCAASGGYTLWHKRRRTVSKSLPVLTAALAVLLALGGVAVQYGVESIFFQATLKPTVVGICIAAAVFGAALGGWLRVRYETVCF
ncbi:MAG: hypothetical protein ACQESV_02910 [Thermodesulfobacteriota bacterium]